MGDHLVLSEVLRWEDVPDRLESLLDNPYYEIISVIPASFSTHREIWYYRKEV